MLAERPRLRVVNGLGITPERDRADFMRRAAELFSEAANAAWATPAERASWASNARQAAQHAEAV